MKLRAMAIWGVLSVSMGSAHAEIFYVDCNVSGAANSAAFYDPDTGEVTDVGNRAFWNRIANAGSGNGGESVDISVDLSTGDATVTCVTTADEETAGELTVLVPGIPDPILIGPVDFGEVDPGQYPIGEAP